ncbi:hypothetical protein SAMN05444128_0294 [Pontibacter indicus]|uniref:Uncharacterized protein n=1 Tax=Pontibacter indicus TaxID=1317125 RepID=A0A1R3WE61_9BACT|nr:hypothetical protein SAMN05444128_0294 [Pontibacter indicus]
MGIHLASLALFLHYLVCIQHWGFSTKKILKGRNHLQTSHVLKLCCPRKESEKALTTPKTLQL